MRKFCPFPVENIDIFRQQVLQASHNTDHFCYLDSNNYPNYPHSTFGALYAIEAVSSMSAYQDGLTALEKYIATQKDWIFGYLSYELKNEIEPELAKKKCVKVDGIQHPLVHFFLPRFIIRISPHKVEVGLYLPEGTEEATEWNAFLQILQPSACITTQTTDSVNIQQRLSLQTYSEIATNIKNHLQRGDIYEMNLCQEFYAENTDIDTIAVFNNLNTISRAPFSCFFKNEQQYLLCASPERFLKKQQDTLITQPIKGTRKRSTSADEDMKLKQELELDDKERSEHIMIVDLVRNDFSKIARPSSVRIEELYGIYTFEQVHQMISTITCEIPESLGFTDILRAVFPMGSMTGAPKLSAMQLIDQYEPTKRGLYSGAVGYITPKGNFDFNVVIRSILYNAKNRYISVQAGSALTVDAIAATEYEECLLKAKAMIQALQKNRLT